MTGTDALTVRARYKSGIEYWTPQRDLERADIAFRNGDQWPADAIKMRDGTGTGKNASKQPRLTVSRIDQPIQLVQNQFQNSHLGVNIHPLSANANRETADVIQGIYRKIERDSMADQARGWAFDRAITAGFGSYFVNKEYDDEAGEELTEAATEDDKAAQFDQKITIERILQQDQVILDPSAQKADFSDGRWAFMASWVPIEEFKTLYPNAKLTEAMSDAGELGQIIEEVPEWVKDENGSRAVLVASYWCKHQTPREIVLEVGGKKLTRTKIDTKVTFAKYAPGTKDGIETLEEADWGGKYIPIIPVIGKELQPVDGRRTWVGIVRPAMDSQRMYNYAITTAVTIAALEPKVPFVGVAGQFSGHEQKWDTLNTIPWTYVEYNSVDVDNKPAPPPQRMPIDSSRLSVSLALMDKADAAIQATTYTPDPALGKHSRDESGKAIEALQGQSEASTSNYVYGMSQVSMPYEALVVLDLIPIVYDRPGRLARILDGQDEEREVILNAPFTMSPDGRPQMTPSPMTASMPPGQFGGPSPMSRTPMQPQQAPQPKPKHYDLSLGRYGVTVSIGKSYKSRFEAGRDNMLAMMQAQPALMMTLGDIFFKYDDAPWADEASKRMKKIIEKSNPDFFKSDDDTPTPEQLQAENEGLKAKLQEATQVIQQAQQEIATDATKQKATLEKAQIDAQSKAEQTQADGQVKLMIEKMQADLALQIQEMKEAAAAAEQERQMRFDAMMAEQDRQHQDRMASKQAAIAHEQAEQAAKNQEIASERDAARTQEDS